MRHGVGCTAGTSHSEKKVRLSATGKSLPHIFEAGGLATKPQTDVPGTVSAVPANEKPGYDYARVGQARFLT